MSYLKGFINHIKNKNIFMFAAQTAFYFLLSLFPFIYIITKLLGVFSLSVNNFFDSLHYFFPQVTFDVIYSNFLTITTETSSIRAVVYSAIGLFSSSLLFNSLKVTFAESYPKDNIQSRLFIRGISVVTTIVILVLIIFSFFAMLLLNVCCSLIVTYIHLPDVAQVVSVLFTITIIIADMMVIYTILPPKRIKFYEALPGALFATAGISIALVLFTYYVSKIADYSKLYGTMGSVIVLLLWLYICSAIIITGGHINAYVIKRKTPQ